MGVLTVNRRDSRETWEERFPRYAHNAGATAVYADKDVIRLKRTAGFHKKAAGNARSHGDLDAAELYEEMAEATLDAAEALEDVAAAARKVAAHYKAKAEEADMG